MKGRMLTMLEPMALAYVNLYGVLGTLEDLCRIDDEAKQILAGLKKPVSLCFSIKNGPCRTFHFSREGCRVTEGDGGGCKMTFSSPEAFNALIDSSKPGLPVRRPLKLILFLTGPFTALTDRLTRLLRASQEDLADRAFFEESTLLTLYTVGGAVCALANSDSISKISASYTPDGSVNLGIKNCVTVSVQVKDHHFTFCRQPAESPRASMEFADIDLANGLFAGTVSTINEMCKGTIRIAGMISMIDNINRILDRVSVYLG